MRIIVHSPSHGTFLGHQLGWAFKTVVPTLYARAMTFSDALGAREFCAGRCVIDGLPDDVQFLEVDTDALTVSMSQCVVAGAKPWDFRGPKSRTKDSVESAIGRHTLIWQRAMDGVNPLSTFLRAQHWAKGAEIHFFDGGHTRPFNGDWLKDPRGGWIMPIDVPSGA